MVCRSPNTLAAPSPRSRRLCGPGSSRSTAKPFVGSRYATWISALRAPRSRVRMRHWLASFYPVWVNGEIIGVGNVVLDITERVEAEAFRGVVMENLVEGVLALDADGRVVYLNRAASSILGWSERELLGKPMHETIHFQHADGTLVPTDECALLRVRTSDNSIRIVNDAFTRKNGTIVPVAYSAASLSSGSINNGLVVAFRDITEEKNERA